MRSRRTRYRIYGLTLESSLALPCPPSRSRSPEVRLRRGTIRRFARARAEVPIRAGRPSWFRCRRLNDGSTYLQWRELFEFLISPDGRRIDYFRLKRATRESFSVYLLGQVLSFSMLAFGVEPLHGTVVVVDGKAVAFLGDCGSGKSTLGAALLARGFPILTDDVMALEERNAIWRVHPGIPRLKLFPSVARRLLGTELCKTPMNPACSKLVLSLGAGQSFRRAVPLGALYVLSNPPARGRARPTQPRVERLSGRDAFLEVIRAAFNLSVFERARLANQFAFATRVAASVPVHRLIYPRRLSALPAVCDMVLASLARSSSGTRDAFTQAQTTATVQ